MYGTSDETVCRYFLQGSAPILPCYLFENPIFQKAASLSLHLGNHFFYFIFPLYRVSHSLPNPLAGGPLLRVATIRRTTDTFLFISHTTNVLLFKFHYNIFIGVRITKEMPGSVASGTHCTCINKSTGVVLTCGTLRP